MKKIIYTNHAIVRRIERDIEEKTIELVVGQPDYIKTTSEGKKIAIKNVDNKIMSVVYIEKDTHIKVITVY
ncbi:MAG TPA: DUF4258 domain-containing protein [archaeon]|nr:DUF4258 domain-containing protein [archaeon]